MCVKTKKREKYYCIKQLKNNYLELFYVECQGSGKYGVVKCSVLSNVRTTPVTYGMKLVLRDEGWAGTTLNIKLVNVQKQKTKLLQI